MHGRADLRESKADIIYSSGTSLGFAISQCVIYLILALVDFGHDFWLLLLVLIVLVSFLLPLHVLSGYLTGIYITQREIELEARAVEKREKKRLSKNKQAKSTRRQSKHNRKSSSSSSSSSRKNTRSSSVGGQTQTPRPHVEIEHWSSLIKPGVVARTGIVYIVALLVTFQPKVSRVNVWEMRDERDIKGDQGLLGLLGLFTSTLHALDGYEYRLSNNPAKPDKPYEYTLLTWYSLLW